MFSTPFASPRRPKWMDRQRGLMRAQTVSIPLDWAPTPKPTTHAIPKYGQTNCSVKPLGRTPSFNHHTQSVTSSPSQPTLYRT
ncbi:unnamed protein product [Protopolystoma xenopodis]|uniref:Uncharacterized protein n=1 Tax=Protopolystoma xenopodis TaxID=117903 RepID=A0A448WAV3_9PLAT|nr:unnamed protein product [Protopolystoma xenopodis]